MNDYKQAKDHRLQMATVKLRCWGTLPWVMASMADCVEGSVRAAACNIWNTSQASPQHQEQHHHLTWAWLREGTCVRQQLVEFIAGGSLDTLHDFRRLLNELCLQRRQEGDHSISKLTGLGPVRFVGASLAFHRRRVLHSRGLGDIAKRVRDLTQSPRFWAKALGSAQHPLIATCLAQPDRAGWGRALMSALACVLYSLDSESQFAALAEARRKMNAADKDAYRVERRNRARRTWAITEADIRQIAINSFLQGELVPGQLYSMPSAVANVGAPTSKLGSGAVVTSEGLELDFGDGDAGQDSSWSLSAHQAGVPEDYDGAGLAGFGFLQSGF